MPNKDAPATAAEVVGRLSQGEFCARFKARMLAMSGATVFDDGESIAGYADATAPTYFQTGWQREEGPETCADADMSYWGE